MRMYHTYCKIIPFEKLKRNCRKRGAWLDYEYTNSFSSKYFNLLFYLSKSYLFVYPRMHLYAVLCLVWLGYCPSGIVVSLVIYLCWFELFFVFVFLLYTVTHIRWATPDDTTLTGTCTQTLSFLKSATRQENASHFNFDRGSHARYR